jgi:multidrug resistance efflux pump
MSRSASLRSRDGHDGQDDDTTAVHAPVATAEQREPAPADGRELANLDALGRIAALGKAFGPAQTEPDILPESNDKQAPTSSPSVLRSVLDNVQLSRGRILKTVAGAALVVVAGWMPVRTLMLTTSTEAIINARLITLRAPIEGQIDQLSAFSVGTELIPGSAMLTIVNPRADRGRVDNLRQQISEQEGDLKALTARQQSLEALRKEHTTNAEAFRTGRMAQLESRVAETESEVAAATARDEEASQTLERAKSLAEAGTGTLVALERARRDATVAARSLEALRHRSKALDVELTALRDGVFVGDSYNDRPQSLQRADEISLRLNETTAEIRQRQSRLSSLQTELAGETARYAERSAAALSSPITGSVWEVMTAPGESISRGQELMRLLDCSGLVVTATVGEAAYNKLRVGQEARFHFRGERTEHAGRIISLTGVATAPANLAIQPAALAKEPYRVTVALPELAKAGRCSVGRTGRVTFSD